MQQGLETIPHGISEEKKAEIDYGQKLIEKGYANSCEYYSGTRDFRTASLENVSEDVRPYVEGLIMLLYGPILRDSVEDKRDEHGKHIAGIRSGIKTKLANENNQDLYDAYASNRLESSSISNTFNMIEFINSVQSLPAELTKEMNDLATQFSETSVAELNPEKYYQMNNEQKYAFVKGPLTGFVEKVMNYLIFEKSTS